MPADRTDQLSSGVIIVRQSESGPLLLMLRAYSHWDFPKGTCEAGETPYEAALREVAEETTLNELQFPWGQVFIDSGPYGRGKTSRYYIGTTTKESVSLPVNPELGRPEHHEWRWVDPGEACDLATPRVQSVLDWAFEIIDVNKLLDGESE